MDFTLPPLTQQSFSRWYNKKVPRTDNVHERIVYPGVPLTCSTKSRDLRSEIEAKHVFITHEPIQNIFHHKVLGSNNVFASLPKRLYSQCFHNINIHSIPPQNRINVRLTENTSIVLPFIPDDFVAQKRSKRGLTTRKTRGNSKKMKREQEFKDSVGRANSANYTGWVSHVLSPDTEATAGNGIDNFRLMSYIRDQLRKNDSDFNLTVPNPFAGSSSIDDILSAPQQQAALASVVQFVHHYGRHF
tara:strand:+ start:3782 stop:4516 length:735 start_codon:yes stop_codon:yes gene_type:complete